MLRIGITGGIGAGKSFVSKRLTTMGFPVFDCDSQGKRLMNEDPAIRIQLIDLLGVECYNEDGLNRAYVAQRLFNDSNIKAAIEQIVHPKVAIAFANWAEEQNSPLVFVESAILYESGFDQYVDKIIMVDADQEVRISRILHRDICTRAQAEERIQAQASSADKRKKADYIIENNPHNDVNQQLFQLVKQLYQLPVD